MTAADLVARLAQEGINPQLLAEVAQELFAGEIERKALADRRKNERDRKARSRAVTGQDVTSAEVQGQPLPEVSPENPLPNLSHTPPVSKETTPHPEKRGKTFIPADWKPPAIADLPPRSRACAEQWTQASYLTEAEAFLLYWRSERKMKTRWLDTWASRIIARHSAVMRDQKFGNAAPETKREPTPAESIANLESVIPVYERMGRTGEAEESRRMIERLRKATPIGALAQSVMRRAL